MTDAYPARLTGDLLRAHQKFDAALIVTDPHEGVEVVVRYKLGRPWRCGACGPRDTADCPHTFAAALLLAEQLLGLTRVPELDPSHERTHA